MLFRSHGTVPEEEEADFWDLDEPGPKKPAQKMRVVRCRMNPLRSKVPPPQMNPPPQARRARDSLRPQRIPNEGEEKAMDEGDRFAVRVGNRTRDRRDDMADLFDDIPDDLLLSKKMHIKRKQMMHRSVGISRNALKHVSTRDIKKAMADNMPVNAALRKKSLAELAPENNKIGRAHV